MGGAPRCRGIRGATTVPANTATAILAATAELLALLIERNDLDVEDIASVFFTVTHDLDAEHPARAARELGWDDVALLCAQEIPVPGSLPRCIRVLLHATTTRSQREIRHVYLREAASLRPTWADQVSDQVSDQVTGAAPDPLPGSLPDALRAAAQTGAAAGGAGAGSRTFNSNGSTTIVEGKTGGER